VNRRDFIGTATMGGMALGLAPRSAPCAELTSGRAGGRRPNIVFFLGDDLGYDSLGCNGSELYKDSTPRIDALAAAGLRFDHCYATGICSPTRAQYATGQYPFRNGTLDIDGSDYRSDPHKPMLTQQLKNAGYTTGKTGKADICPSKPDEQLTGWPYWAKDAAKWKLAGPSALTPDRYEYFTEAQRDFALDFVTRNRPRAENGFKPFYFLFGFNNPHVPIERTPDTAPGTTDITALYRDNIRYIDRVVGAVVDRLRELGELENTIILVSGDNGSLGTADGARRQSRVWDPKTSTFRAIDGGKADRTRNREGTALVPLVVHWPAGIPRERWGMAREELVDFSDFLPTFSELAGAAIPAEWVLDGRSFAPLLRGDPAYTPREWVYHQIENNWCLRGPRYRLNRDGRFFDMSDAPFAMAEMRDLTPEQRAIRDRYQAVLDRFDPVHGVTYEGHQDCEWKNPAWEWKQKHFRGQAWETPAAGDASDPDGDGVTNVFERAFGWDPKNGTDRMPEPVVRGAESSLTVPQVRHNDVAVTALGSEDGETWTPLEPSGSGPFVFSGRAASGRGPYRIRIEAARITPWPEP